jgi:hypothetical protein
MVLLSSRSIQAFFDQNGQMLVAISQNMDTLREQNKQTSEILTTFRTASTDSPDEALEKFVGQRGLSYRKSIYEIRIQESAGNHNQAGTRKLRAGSNTTTRCRGQRHILFSSLKAS